MKIPERLQDWTLTRIEKILQAGVCENDRFDFKERLPAPADAEGKHRLRKSIVAFANSGGGFFIYGVKDDRSLSVQDRLIGISLSIDFQPQFGTFASDCIPSVEWHARVPPIEIPGSGSALHVFEISSNWRKPHAVMRDGAAYFVKRTNKGDEAMSFGEIATAFRESEFRRTGLALLISELEHMRETAEGLLKDSAFGNTEAHPDRRWTWAVRYSTTLIDTTLGNIFPFLKGDAALWKLLCSIRENARSSNAMSEAFASVLFLRQTERITIYDSLTRGLIDCAKVISKDGQEAAVRLKQIQ
jgi:hypothetical protein